MFFSSHLKVAMDQSSWSRQAGRRAGAHFRVAQQAVSTFKSIFTQRRGKTNERKRKTPTDSKVKAPSGFAVLATAAAVVATTVVVSRLCIWCLRLCVCVCCLFREINGKEGKKKKSQSCTRQKKVVETWKLISLYRFFRRRPPTTNCRKQRAIETQFSFFRFFFLDKSWQRSQSKLS